MTTTAEQVAALNATLQMFMAESRGAMVKADTDRTTMMGAINDQGRALERLAEDMAEVKPVTDMVTGLHAKFVGAAIILGIIGAVAWAGVLFFKESIIGWLGD